MTTPTVEAGGGAPSREKTEKIRSCVTCKIT